ncbi:aminotransferase family protein [Actinophytocola sediminis]
MSAFQWPAETRSFCAEMPFSEQTALFEHGKGVHLFDAQGRTYLDSLSGVFVVCFGYDCQPIVSAMTEQLQKLAFIPPLHGTNRNAIDLAHGLVELAPDGISSVKLLSGGSEAVECAVRLARLYHVLRGKNTKQKVLSNYQSYHGATYGSLALTGHPSVGIFGAPMPAVVHTWPPEAVAEHWNLDMPAASEQAAMLIERTIENEGPDSIAALIVEPMSGVRAMAVPDTIYFTKLREICDRHDILLIFDEIVTGFGRTGTPFAAQGVGVTPDLLCAGKGISSGYAPLSALLIHERIAGMFRDGDNPMAFGPTHTYSGNPIAAAAGLAAVNYFNEGDFLPRINRLGDRLQRSVREIVGDRGAVNGKGLLCGIRFPDPDGRAVGDLVEQACLRRGVIVRGMIDGLMIAPPFVISDEELDEVLSVLTESIDEVVGA